MSENIEYRISYLTGSVSFERAAPGFVRLVTRDDAGNVISDVTNHYVCLGYDGGACVFCGEPLESRQSEAAVKGRT